MQVRWLIPFVLLLLIAATACAPSAAGETAVPTFTLIPVTPSTTPTDVPPTSTPADLPAPQDVLSATETPTRAAPTSAAPSDDPLLSQDPVAAELVGIAQRFVSADLDLPTSRIRLVSVVPVAWTDSSLNCPQPNSDAVQQETDGYRIVVQAGDQEFLFHTDFDRVVPCDFDDEQLPAGVILPTEEATTEAT